MKHSLQMSETLRLGIILALSGGFMDAYSYLERGNVFANAQTGNLLLFGVNLAEGNYFANAQLSPPCSRVYSRHLTCRYCALPQHTTPLASAFRSVGSCYFNMCSLFPSLFKSPRKLTHLFCLRHSGRKLSQDPQQRSGYNYVYRKLKKRNRESAPLSANP